jgi:hypothetical protein
MNIFNERMIEMNEATRHTFSTDYGKLASRTDASNPQTPEQSLRLPGKARNPDKRVRLSPNPKTGVLLDFCIAGSRRSVFSSKV